MKNLILCSSLVTGIFCSFSILTVNGETMSPPPYPGNQTQGQQGMGPDNMQGQNGPPSPSQMAQQMMSKFDTNKNNELSLEELTKALEFMQKNRPGAQGNQGQGQGGPGMGGQNMGQGGQSQGQGGQNMGASGQQGPQQMVSRLLGDFDKDKDKKLSKDELTKAMEFLEKNRPNQQQGNNSSFGSGSSKSSSSGSRRSGKSGQQQPQPPSADKIAAEMIEKFSSDKKGLSEDELIKAFEYLRSQRRQQQQGMGQGGQEGMKSRGQPSFQ